MRSATLRRGLAAAWIVAVAGVSGCTPPTPSDGAAAGCVEVGGAVARLSWSQRGRFLAVGYLRADGVSGARVLNGDLSPAGDAIADPGMLRATVVVSAAGAPAWLAAAPGAPGAGSLVEVAVERRELPVPGGVLDLQWTAVGYALLQRPPDGRSQVLLFDPDRPDDPAIVHVTPQRVERLWVSADPEHLLLTSTGEDGRVRITVVGPTESLLLAPPDADLSGASMPGLRHHVVYRSTVSGTMVGLVVDDTEPLEAPVELDSSPALLGAISDLGVLAYVPEAGPSSVCVVDVAARLPVPATR